MTDITRSGFDTDPTGIRKYAFDLNKAYAQKIGAIPTPTPMKALIDGNITVKDLERRLKLAGLEMYPDASGANFIRTIEAGDLHREIVKAERAVTRHLRTETVAHSPYEPPITRQVPIDDPDAAGDADWQDAADFGERA
jgi:hypothetical protein